MHPRRNALALILAVTLALVASEVPVNAAPVGVVVAVGDRNDATPGCDPGRSVSSSDAGITWPLSATAYVPTTAPCWGGGRLYDVARRGNVLLAVGTEEVATASKGVALRSTDDGATWHAVGSIPPTPPGTVALEAIASDKTGRWVAGGVSNGTLSPYGLYYSDDDGATWTAVAAGQVPTSTIQVHDIAERPGSATGWVAVGAANTTGVTAALTMASGNGSTWTQPATWGTSRSLALRGVAIAGTGAVVAVGTSRAVAAPANVDAPLIMVKGAGAGTYALWQTQYLADTSKGGLRAVATDAQGNTIMVGARAVGTTTAAVAYRLPGSPTAPLPSLTAALPPGIEALEDIATDQQGTWVVVGGDQGAVSRSTNLGATWGPEVHASPGPKAPGVLRGVTFRT